MPVLSPTLSTHHSISSPAPLPPPLPRPAAIQPEPRPGPLALWHLLSLDAPTVAALWTWFVARSLHLRLPIPALLAMALAVWTLYAADRLLDARLLDIPQPASRTPRLPPQTSGLEARHRFHHRFRPAFLAGIFAASLTLAFLLPRLDPRALRLDTFLGALLALYLLLIHTTHGAHRLPKEIAVGPFFAAAIFIPSLARAPLPGLAPLLLPSALLFALLCSLNCLFIYHWEHPVASPRPHPATRFALRHLTATALVAFVAGLLLTALAATPAARPGLIHTPAPLLPAACTLSVAALLGLNLLRGRLAPVTLRAAADLALLTPLLFAPLLARLPLP